MEFNFRNDEKSLPWKSSSFKQSPFFLASLNSPLTIHHVFEEEKSAMKNYNFACLITQSPKQKKTKQNARFQLAPQTNKFN